jgi:hypothetical protein
MFGLDLPTTIIIVGLLSLLGFILFRKRPEVVIDQWSMIVAGASGKENRIMEEVEKLLSLAQMPQVQFSRNEIGVGFFASKRDFLILRHDYFKNYRILLGTRAYGSSLDASWFLMFRPRLFRRKPSMENVDLFTQQDLRAFASISLHCMKKALEALCEELQQDQAGLNTSSKGFLSVW